MDFLTLFRCYRGKDDMAKGRRSMLISSVLVTLSRQLTGGIFYTGFLAAYGFDVVNIGIVALAPYISIFFTMLSPYFLRHFKRRKWVLGITRLCSYTMQIAGFNLVPILFHENGARVLAFSIIVACGNIISGLTEPGYTTWQSYFLTEDSRPSYLLTSQFLCNLIPGIMVMLSGVIADALANSPAQLVFLTLLRWLAYLVAIADVAVLLLPKEFEQKEAAQPRLADIFRIPLSNRNWCRIVVITAVWSISSAAINTALPTYLLQDVGVSYSYYNLIIVLYSVAFPIFSGFWRKRIDRTSWLTVYSGTLFVYAFFQIVYGFVNARNYLWLMTILRLSQHVVGVGQNTANANLQYICLPEENRTCYIALYAFITNACSMLGQSLGTLFCARTLERTFMVCGYAMPSVPFLVLLTGVIQVLLSGYVLYLSRRPGPWQKHD